MPPKPNPAIWRGLIATWAILGVVACAVLAVVAPNGFPFVLGLLVCLGVIAAMRT